MQRRQILPSDDTGAILIFVAVSITAVLVLSMFVVDYGAFWVARRQAQNAADAAAHAGALTMALDPSEAPDDAALSVLKAQRIWGRLLDPADAQRPVVANLRSVSCPDSGLAQCYRADVTWNYVPSFFGSLVGRSQQTARATAIAEVKAGNSTRCLKPFAIPDLWNGWSDVNNTFDVAAGDAYTKPTSGSDGTGYRLPADLGRTLTFNPWCVTGPCPSSGLSVPQSNRFLPVNLNPPGCLATRDTIANCATACDGSDLKVTFDLDQFLPFRNGNFTSNTFTKVSELRALDPLATFDSATNTINNSCVHYNGIPGDSRACPQFTESPRIISLPAYDPQVFEAGRCPSCAPQIQITKIVSVFIVDVLSNGTITANIVRKTGVWNPGGRAIGAGSSFAPMVVLVR